MSSSDWDGTIDALSATTPPAPVEHTLWKLTKGTRVAEARVRPHPLGQELVFSMNGELLWSQVFNDGRGTVLGEVAESKRAEFMAMGWSS